MTHTAADIARHQCPAPGELVIDHVAHFVEDLEAAVGALEAIGFVATPRSDQTTRDLDGNETPAGQSNRCVMLDAGYLEILTPTVDTPTSRRTRAQMARYAGVHILAFGTPSADEDHARLARHGFDPLAPVDLRRAVEVETDAGLAQALARFAVQRVPPERMPEGRVQFCEQRTPECLWQPRYLRHVNGVRALAAVIVCAEDPVDAGARFARFAGLLPAPGDDFVRLHTARGSVLIGTHEACSALLGGVPRAPALAGYALACDDPSALARRLEAQRCEVRAHPGELMSCTLPAALGGAWLFGRSAALSDWLQA
ncbi:MAG: VOC family protein [Burkholderiales bacterium]|nr:VOC family protein [Burkholderiales bacterium]